MSRGSAPQCPSCGAAVAWNSADCPKCGADLPPRTASEQLLRPLTDPGGWSSGEPLAPIELSREDGVLATGDWRVLGSSYDADIVVASGKLASRGVRVRRVGGQVEVEKLRDDVDLRVDGKPVRGRGVTVSLGQAQVTVDGVLVSDGMVPADTLSEEELPEFFAPVTIGRAPDCDFVIDNPSISAHHARITREKTGLLLEDLDSANGTFVDDRRVKRARIDWRTPFELSTVRLTAVDVLRSVRSGRADSRTSVVGALQDSSLDPVLDSSADQIGPGATLPQELPGGRAVIDFRDDRPLVVGRDRSCDIVLDTPNVSRLHARMRRTEGGIEVEDLGSTNGTWVNGHRIRGRTVIKPSDDLRFGPHKVELTSDLRVRAEQAQGQGGVQGVALEAFELARRVPAGRGSRVVVDDVSFSILPGEMVAIMGPSGAGKTSVLTTLAGYTPPSSGQVYIDDLSLYDHYDVFRSAIGYVPQEDVMHRSLTAEEVLYYHARLHFPSDIADDEIHRRIDVVLRRLDLDHVRDSIVGDEVRRGLSGGQRKRLNVAMELLSEPSLLLLDEPTSGLDARSAMQLIKQCRGLANAGRTVVMTIHQPRREAFELFDKLLLLTKGGKLAYFGPARHARRYFVGRSEVSEKAARNPADYVLDVLDPVEEALAKEPAYWNEQFEQSQEHQRFVSRRRVKHDEAQEARAVLRRPRRRKASVLKQFWYLTRRYALLKWRDRGALAIQLAQAPVIGVLALLLFRNAEFHATGRDEISPALFVIVAAAVWFGISNVAREIVGERAQFRRERYRRLRSTSYLLSKVAVQGTLIAAQVVVLVAILGFGMGLQASPALLVGVPLLAGWAAMAMGLLNSALARSELAAIQLVPLVVLPQIILSGILMPVAGEDALASARLLSKPMLLRWAMGAFQQVEIYGARLKDASRFTLDNWGKYADRTGFMPDSLPFDLGVCGGIGVLCFGLTWLVLSLRDRR